MGDLSLNQKYPDSWRIDHPDFGDVRQTNYAKGIIKDFDKISDDPLKVQSMVTVEVEGKGVSGFLPLFYHPKKQYWDNQDGLATTFNQGGGYFEKAWMSFRAGDEVRVMLREGKPYAVVGFYDGKPRIGEDVFQLQWLGGPSYPTVDLAAMQPLSRQLQLSKAIVATQGANPACAYSGYNEEKRGPDGLSLGLIKVIDSPCAIRPDKNNINYKYYFWFFNVGPISVILYLLATYFGGTNILWGNMPVGSGNFMVNLYKEGMQDKVIQFLNLLTFNSDAETKLAEIGFKPINMAPDFTGAVEHSNNFDKWFNPDSLKIYLRPHTSEEI